MAFSSNSIQYKVRKFLLWDQVSIRLAHITCAVSPHASNPVSVSLSIDRFAFRLHYTHKLRMISPLDCSLQDKVHFLSMTNQVQRP